MTGPVLTCAPFTVGRRADGGAPVTLTAERLERHVFVSVTRAPPSARRPTVNGAQASTGAVTRARPGRQRPPPARVPLAGEGSASRGDVATTEGTG